MHAFLNPAVRRDDTFRGLFTDDEYQDVRAYFAARAALAATPLTALPSMAYELGLRAIDAKNETGRFGLNAFKVLGVRYAVHRLGSAAVRRGLVCATAGNHGRAVARVARDAGVPCTVFLPVARTTDPAEQRRREGRAAAMRGDGATVVEVEGSYEQAVRQAAAAATQTGATVVSDTSWEGYDEIPRWIMAGYTQMFEEAAAQWESPPHVVVVQAGVGGLLCAAASWFAARYGAARPFMVSAEPEQAACLLASAHAGRPVLLSSSLDTIMAGLRCAEPSGAAWPAIAGGVDAFVTVSDGRVRDTMALLCAAGGDERIEAGPSGACGLAALRGITADASLRSLRSIARLDGGARALVVITEG